MNRYYCKLTDKHYTESTIKANLSRAYKEHYLFEPSGSCEGCNGRGENTAHIIPKARLKVLKLVSLIWNPEVWFRACTRCNLSAENPDSDEIKELLNYERILEVTEKWDKERFLIMTL